MHIDFIKLMFYSISAVTLFAAGMVVFSRNPVRAVLSLVLTFSSMAGLWMLLQSEFLSLALILIYVGAVMVLFLFVVMMLKIGGTDNEPNPKGVAYRLAQGGGYVVGGLLAFVLIAQIIWLFSKDVILAKMSSLPVMPADYSSINALGMTLFSEYLYPFEIAGVILTVAIIAAIGLATPGPRQRRIQNVAAQIATKKSDRLTVLKNITPDSGLSEVK